MEDAEAESAAAQSRLHEAKDMFDTTARMLAQTSSTTSWNSYGKRSSTSSINEHMEKRAKSSTDTPDYGIGTAEENHTAPKIEAANAQQQPVVTIPTNTIHMPKTFHSLHNGENNMPEQAVTMHREQFYQKLLGTASTAEWENYLPNPSQANLRSKSQLLEGIHIVRHWETGADGLDSAQFRAKHKNWYSKMKPVTQNLGRRTGIHIRTLEPAEGEMAASETVLCRYSSDCQRSIPYLSVPQIYDAIAEIHFVEQNQHFRGYNSALKARCDELYANIPQGQVQIFLETCPLCAEKRGKANHVGQV